MSRATSSPPSEGPTDGPGHDMNRVLLAGSLAEAPELRELEAGSAVCFLRLQCTWNQAPQILGDDGQHDVNILLLGERARKIAPYLYAGRRLVVDGSLASASWESGTYEQETVCVLGERIELLGRLPQARRATRAARWSACCRRRRDRPGARGTSCRRPRRWWGSARKYGFRRRWEPLQAAQAHWRRQARLRPPSRSKLGSSMRMGRLSCRQGHHPHPVQATTHGAALRRRSGDGPL
jgi:single-stranded DNA-binding protein